MAKILGEPYQIHIQRAEKIKEAINDQLWVEDNGFYGQYLYGRAYFNLSKKFEALGEALAILFDVADQDPLVLEEPGPLFAQGVRAVLGLCTQEPILRARPSHSLRAV